MSDGLKVVYQHQLEASKPVLATPETSPFLKALAWVKKSFKHRAHLFLTFPSGDLYTRVRTCHFFSHSFPVVLQLIDLGVTFSFFFFFVRGQSTRANLLDGLKRALVLD